MKVTLARLRRLERRVAPRKQDYPYFVLVTEPAGTYDIMGEVMSRAEYEAWLEANPNATVIELIRHTDEPAGALDGPGSAQGLDHEGED